jgi:hypothetical protein
VSRALPSLLQPPRQDYHWNEALRETLALPDAIARFLADL